MKQNNFGITIYATLILMLIAFFVQPFGILGFVAGILYAQIIEWFVHGWIQHHPFKIFRAYRRNHTYHHAHPKEPMSVQPVQYFIIGSIPLIAPFWWLPGFWSAYFFAYAMINIIHYDLHSEKRMLARFIWDTGYFRMIEIHHRKHHEGHHGHHSTNSVTNPYMDYLFDRIRLTKMNNYIAKKLKI
jgi:hypothetical protein